jgi:hypothetical protein
LVGLRAAAATNMYGVGLAIWLGWVAGIVPHAPLVCDRVDIIELNRVYDERGRPTLTQMIFWEWREHDARPHVVAWRLWPERGLQPTRDWSVGDYVLLWHDGELLREVRAARWSESWTQHDPEMEDRTWLPKAARRGLTLDSAGKAPTTSHATNP